MQPAITVVILYITGLDIGIPIFSMVDILSLIERKPISHLLSIIIKDFDESVHLKSV